MSKVKVASFSISLDGFGAGPNQDLQNPLGLRGMELHQWVFKTDSFQKMHGEGSGEKGIDNDFSEKAMANVGAWILGRNMFGPIRGPWLNEDWKGWWGENPPYHVPIFVLTHHKREPLRMAGDNTFHFVTDGIESALKQAKAAAGDKDVRIGGGVATIRQYLKIGAIDEIHLAVAPVILGSGENLFVGLNLAEMGYAVTSYTPTPAAAHIIIEKK